MKHLCINCHFLAKEYREENTGRPLSFSVSQKERDKALSKNVDFVADHYCLKCHMGVWDEGVSPGKGERLSRINETKRKGQCFFYPYNPAMLFDAAKELQNRSHQNEQLKRSNLYTRIGLWISALALLAGAVIGILRLSL